MAEIASAFVSLLPSARGFGPKLDSQISPEINASGKKAGLSFGKLFAVGAALGIGAKAFSFLGDSLAEATDAAVVGSRTENVIKKMGNAANISAAQVGDLAASISNKTAIDDEAIQAGQNLLLTFGQVRNEAGKGNDIFNQTSRLMVDMSAAMGTDAKSAALQLGKALNDPVRGVTALTRSGVSFTQQQKDQIKTLQESGNVLGAQKIILGEVEKQFGGAGAAMATPAERAKVAFGNLQESLGTKLLPVVNKVLTFFVDQGIPAISRFAGVIGSTLGPIFTKVGTVVTTTILPALTALATKVQANVGPVFAQAVGIVQTRVLPILSRLGAFFVGTLIPAVVKVAQSVASKLRPVFDQLASTFRSKVLPTLNKVLTKFAEWQPTIQKVIVVVVKIVGKVLEFAAVILGKLLPPVIKFAGFIIANVVPAVLGFIGVVAKIIGKVIEFGGALVRGAQKAGEFLTGVKDKIGGALTFVAGIPGKILGVFGNAATVLYNAGVQLITGLANGIKTKIEDAVNAVKDGLGRIKGLLPGSPIKWGPLKNWNNGGAGKRLMSLVARGITDGSKITVKAAEGAFGKIEGALEASRDKLKSTLEGLKGDFAALASSVSGAFLGDLFGVTATDAVEASEGVAAVAGRTVGQNFVDNLLAKKGELTGLLASFKTLTGWGINPAFLSQLFASGNGALITELAGMGQAGAANAASLFGEVTSLGAQLGGAVAQNDPVASAIATTNVKLDEVNDQLRFLNDTIGPKLNRSAKEVATQAAKGVSNGGNKAARRGKRNGK